MPRFSCALAALLFAVSIGQPACASQPVELSYARALRFFNSHLNAATATLLAAHLLAEADAQHLDARLLVALVAVESSWRPNAISSAGAIGLGQLMPATAASIGVDPNDANANLHGVALHLRSLLLRYGTPELAIAAYNAGAGAVDHFGGIPTYSETHAYVRSVLALWRQLRGF